MMVVAIGLFIWLGIMAYHFHHKSLLFIGIDLIWIIIAGVVVVRWTEPLSQLLSLWVPYPNITLESSLTLYQGSALRGIPDVFIRSCASLLMMGGLWLLRAFVYQWLRPLEQKDHSQKIVGALFGIAVGWGVVATLLSWLSLINMTAIQQLFTTQPLLGWIVTHTPIISTHLLPIWFGGMVPFL
ncbi:MAG: hypothetical protein Q4A55_07400 [Aerococcus sp.]|nr:hypothetical protein [Aerococcus sp.]